MSAEDIIQISSRVGFKNKRYIKLHPELFQDNLSKVITKYESITGSKILSNFSTDDITKSESSIFANMSIPESLRHTKIPNVIDDKKFKREMNAILKTAHNLTKKQLKDRRASSKKQPSLNELSKSE